MSSPKWSLFKDVNNVNRVLASEQINAFLANADDKNILFKVCFI